mmetsp:Transcript_17397/g.27098  ORF Transcript_17397/g.27098 Transcript_17397/m.27098 type:complete len:513 (+) Transcript_17397:1703-3241(+)
MFQPYKFLFCASVIFLLHMNCVYCGGVKQQGNSSFAHKHHRYHQSRSAMSHLLAKAKPLSQAYGDHSSSTVDYSRHVPEFIQSRQLTSSGLDDYTLKFVRCQSINTYNDDMASDYNATSVLSREDFVVLRLCPDSYCNNNFYFGCTYNYVDYMIQLADYLNIVYTYRVQSRDNYCSMCQECTGRRRKLENGEDNDEEQEENDQEDVSEDENMEEEDADNNEEQNNDNDEDEESSDSGEISCDDFDSNCGQYCSSSSYSSSSQIAQYDNFFECTKFDGSSNYGKSTSLYVGSRCTSDTTGIEIGIFYDNYCTQSAEDSYNLDDFTGMYFPDGGMADYYDTTCFSCDGQGDAVYQQLNNDVYSESKVCARIVSEGASCEENIDDASFLNQSSTSSQSSETTCNFINSILSGRYNEDGDIYSNRNDYVNQETTHYFSSLSMTASQICIIIGLVLTCTALFARAAFLHHMITRSQGHYKWKPDSLTSTAGRLSRQETNLNRAANARSGRDMWSIPE